MHPYKGLLIIGFGGHARSVADVALANGIESLLFVDENARDGEHFLGHPVLRDLPADLPGGWQCISAAGDNRRRHEQTEAIVRSGWPLATLIAPTASVGTGAITGEGSFIAHHAHVGPMARIGKGAIVNTGAVIEHECIVGDFTHVSVNASLAGRSRLGDFVFQGVGSTVIDGIAVGSNIMIGAGAVVVRSLETPGTYIGVPARRLNK